MTAYAETHPMDLVEALEQTLSPRAIDDPGPDWRYATTRRIVEVTDQDETLVPEFISLHR